MTSSRLSSLGKSVTWRVMGVLVLGAVTYFFTRHWVITTAITLVHHSTFVVVFYLHERAWMRVGRPTGRARNVIKALTYEIILGMGIGGLIVLAFTGQWSKVTAITGTYTAIKLVMYYFYDRAWRERAD
jgi:uncharacterized membrane protein